MLPLLRRFRDILTFSDTEPMELALGFLTFFRGLWLNNPEYWHASVVANAMQALPAVGWMTLMMSIGIWRVTSVLTQGLGMRTLSAFSCFVLWMYLFVKFALDGFWWQTVPVNCGLALGSLWTIWRLQGRWFERRAAQASRAQA